MPSSEDAHSTNHHLNLTRQPSTITKLDRTRLNGHHPKCIWFTGLPGAGKSTLANALEVKLAGLGLHTYLLDGDNIRLGLNKDLGMSLADRDENIRRVSEVAKLMVDAGLVVIAAFISPTQSSRQQARERFAPGEFVEIFVDTSLAECEKRDPKGLYKKARAGLIKEFTGIDNPYERPAMPDVVVDTAHHDVETCVRLLLAQLDLS